MSKFGMPTGDSFMIAEIKSLEAELSTARGESDSVHKMFDTEHEQLLRVEKKNKQLQAENERLKKLVDELESQKCLKHCCERITFAV